MGELISHALLFYPDVHRAAAIKELFPDEHSEATRSGN
jgi:hypothetical protein